MVCVSKMVLPKYVHVIFVNCMGLMGETNDFLSGFETKTNKTGILNLGVNELVGGIPTTIGELANLETVFLETNFLGADRGDDGSVLDLVPDSLPSQIGRLTNLQILNLKNNFLSTSGDLSFDYFVTMTNLSKYLQPSYT